MPDSPKGTGKEGTGEPVTLESLKQQLEGDLKRELEVRDQRYTNLQSAYNKRDREVTDLRRTVESLNGKRDGEPRRKAVERFTEADDDLLVLDDDPVVRRMKRELDTRDKRNDRLSQRLAESTFKQDVKNGSAWLEKMEKAVEADSRLAGRHRFIDDEGNVDYERSIRSLYNELRLNEFEKTEEEAGRKKAEEEKRRRRSASADVISGDDSVDEGGGIDMDKLPEDPDALAALLEKEGLIDMDNPPSPVNPKA